VTVLHTLRGNWPLRFAHRKHKADACSFNRSTDRFENVFAKFCDWAFGRLKTSDDMADT
jgi:hypothetical protein